MNQMSHYKQSELIALLLTATSMKDISHSLLLTEAQVQRAACAIYQRAKVDGRVGLMAREIERLRDRKGMAA